jgi:hypothetical protein
VSSPVNDRVSVYSEDRERRLRWVLYVLGFVSGVTAIFGVLVAMAKDGADRGPGIFVTVTGAVLLVLCLASLRVLPTRAQPAKRMAVTTGAVTLVASLLLAGTWAAYLLPVLALVLLFLALIADDPQGQPK